MANGIKKIATEGDIYSKFGISMTSYTNRCVRYSSLAYYGLTTNKPYGTNQLVVLDDVIKMDPILTLYVSLEDVIDYIGDYDEMPYLNLMLTDDNAGTLRSISSTYGFTTSLTHNNYPNCYISGTLSAWSSFYDDYSGLDYRICLQEPMGNSMCSGYLTSDEWDIIYDMIAHETDGHMTWPSGGTFPFSISQTTWFPSNSASSITVSVTAPSNIFTVTKSASWITVTKSGNSTTVSVTANTSSSNRTGYVYYNLAGNRLTLTVTQSAAVSYTIPISYVTFGWNRSASTSLDVTLSGQVYGGSSTPTICTSKAIRDGQSYGAISNTKSSITTLNLPAISGVSLRFWGINNGNGTGKVYVIKNSNSGTRSIVAQASLDVWGGSYSSPTLSVSLANHVNGDSYEVWFEQGGQINGDVMTAYDLMLATSKSTGKSTRVDYKYGSWLEGGSTPIPGYTLFKSNSSYHVANGYDVMRVWFSGFKGTLTFYIRSYGESTYDYTMISQIDQVMSPTRVTNNTSTFSNTELVKAHTRGKQNSGTTSSAYTAATYTVPDNGVHFVDIVYRKDSGVDTGDDRGYVLIPNEYLA